MPAEIDRLLAERAVESTLVERVVVTDYRNWTRVRQILADRVHLDMGSRTDSEAGTLTPSESTLRRDAGLSRLEDAHHQLGNVQVTLDGNTADNFAMALPITFCRTRLAAIRVPLWVPTNSASSLTARAGGLRP